MTVDLTIFQKQGAQKRDAILALEKEVLSMPQIKLENKHYFAKGLYARELFMPKGSVVTGKIHLQEHLCIISYGDVTVTTDNGTERFTGPCTFVGQPGSKRALLMHEDTLWTAIHSTNSKTVEEAEAELVTNDYEQINKLEKQPCLSG